MTLNWQMFTIIGVTGFMPFGVGKACYISFAIVFVKGDAAIRIVNLLRQARCIQLIAGGKTRRINQFCNMTAMIVAIGCRFFGAIAGFNQQTLIIPLVAVGVWLRSILGTKAIQPAQRRFGNTHEIHGLILAWTGKSNRSNRGKLFEAI